MPIPKPKDNETEEEFISRCMGNDTMNEEYPENDQRAAVCYSSYRRNKAEQDIEFKKLQLELKGDKPGSFIARFATLEVVDLDKDVAKPGAFPTGKTVLVSSYQHGSWQGKLPVGKATISERDNAVIAEGEFNLNTVSGKEHYEAIKFSGNLQEWSYGFKAVEWEMGEQDGQEVRFLKKVDVFEISPVMKGAGKDTMTLAIKSTGMTFADQAEMALAAVSDLVSRSKSLADLRRKDGRALSTANRERLSRFLEPMYEATANLKDLLDEQPIAEALADALLLEYAGLKAKLAEVLK